MVTRAVPASMLARQVARRAMRLGRRYPRPGDVAHHVDPKNRQSPALEAIDSALIDLMRPGSDHDALAVFMPPQEGKSQRVSRTFSEWLLDHNPRLRIAIVSYGEELALRWGRDIKLDVTQNPCPNGGGSKCQEACGGLHIRIRQDSASAGRWETPQGGGVYCVGVGGPLTGKPVDILIIDDPVKDRQTAESDTIRNNTWDWWESVALLRMASPPKVVLIQCMTGDTLVLMGDGTERPLRDVRPGDVVATYENGAVTTAVVRNWANQGPDALFSIRMRSGRTVRANARHPFLTVDENGAESWQRTDTLRPGSRIRLVTGANGGESPAPNVIGPQDAPGATAKGSACPTTTSSGGAVEYARHPSTLRQAGRRTSSTAMGSMWRSMTGSSPRRAASALSAPIPPAAAGQNLTTRDSASTTTMTPGVSGGCSAIAATLPLDTSEHRQTCSQPLSTYSVSYDEVAEIIPAGFEDVFDIEVERTHTFIANGLATHNTRWHEDDLAGRILSRPSPLKWKILRIPAIADSPDDPLGRALGEELPSVRGRPPGYFYNLKATMSPYVFAGVFQQSPTAAEGNFFRKASFRYWRWTEPWADGRERILCEGQPVTLVDCWRYVTMDFAASTKSSADYTVASMWAVTPDGHLILLDRERGHVEDHEHYLMAQRLQDAWGACTIYVEQNWWSKTFTAAAVDAGVGVAGMRADTDKVTRAVPAAGRIHAGRVWFPAEAPWLDEWVNELAAFPMGSHDDQVDTLSYAVRVQVSEWTPAKDQGPRPGRTAWEQAVSQAHASSTGGAEVDFMNVQY